MHRLCTLILVVALASPLVGAQQISKLDRGRAEEILKLAVKEVKKHYYDPTLHGFDIDAREQQAMTRIANSQSLGQALTAIGWTLDGLNDSHTVFIPPIRTMHVDYGWQMQMIGNDCYVTRVKPGTDAEKKGLKAGDQVLSVNGFTILRGDFQKFEYVFYLLRPLPEMELKVRSPEGAERTLMIKSGQYQETRDMNHWDLDQYLREGMEENRNVFYETDDVLFLKLKSFEEDEKQVNEVLGELHNKKAVLLDLRGNPGGAVDVLARVLGDFFDHKVKIGDRVGREKQKPQFTETSRDPYSGKVVVLVDSHSASAAEIFARVMQLEKRGTVVGDRSEGMVMEARYYDYHPGAEDVFFFGLEITDADIIMSDGKSLEGHGVAPDELVLPTAKDLAAGRDPALARGAALLGVKMTPEEAGKIFPFRWPKV